MQADLTFQHGDSSWQIGEWTTVSGDLACCSNGLHAAARPRDSLWNMCGQRWFIAEARGETVTQGDKFAAREMRIVTEIPRIVLQRYATWCANECLGYYEAKYPTDNRLSDCIQTTERYLDGKATVDQLNTRREAAGAAAAEAADADASRAVAAAIAAANAADGDTPAWASAAAAAAYAAHTAADAIAAAHKAADTTATAHDVDTAIAGAAAADDAAAAAHTAAAAATTAHAAAWAAAHDAAVADDAADPYTATQPWYAAQDRKLIEMIDQHLADKPV